MAKQSIGVGSSANDGTGDPLRTAFQKINGNFDELYGVSGILKANGSNAVSAAVAGTDFISPGAVNQSILGVLSLPNQTAATAASAINRALLDRTLMAIDPRWMLKLDMCDFFNGGTSGDWGSMRWQESLTSSASVALASSTVGIGGRLNMQTGATSGSNCRIVTRAGSTGMYAYTIFNVLFTTPSSGQSASTVDDAIVRIGYRNSSTAYLVLESDSANAPHTWRWKFQPSSGSFQTADTGAQVGQHVFNNTNRYAMTLVGHGINELVLGGQSAHMRVIIRAATPATMVTVADVEIPMTGQVNSPFLCIEVENKTAANRQLFVEGVRVVQLPGQRYNF